MDREQKTAVIDRIATQIDESEAIFAVDYRGITVPQINELRIKLIEAGAAFTIVKNTLTELAADKVGRAELKEFLQGPTAFTFVTGDIALAAKTINRFIKDEEIMAFKGGVMEGQPISVEQITELAKLPGRDALNAQLVGVLSSPITTVVRGLGSMVQGLATALGQLQEQKAQAAPAEESAPAEEVPAAEAEESKDNGEAPAEDAPEDPQSEESVEEQPASEEGESDDQESEDEGAQEEEAEAAPEPAEEDSEPDSEDAPASGEQDQGEQEEETPEADAGAEES